MTINLGDEVKDSVTGFKGIAVARTEWIHGCPRITIQPPVGKDGKHPESGTFDEMAIILVKAKKVKAGQRPAKTGGPQERRRRAAPPVNLRFTVTVEVDPREIEGKPADIVRDEIRSNLESVDYVKGCEVTHIERPKHTVRVRS